jgi:hypothetical protein
LPFFDFGKAAPYLSYCYDNNRDQNPKENSCCYGNCIKKGIGYYERVWTVTLIDRKKSSARIITFPIACPRPEMPIQRVAHQPEHCKYDPKSYPTAHALHSFGCDSSDVDDFELYIVDNDDLEVITLPEG